MAAGAHVLVVDDDEDILKLLTMRLRAKGFRITAVGSAEQALAQIAVDPPRVVVSDVRLPGLDGLALFEEIRRSGFVRMRVDGKSFNVSESPTIDHRRKHAIEVVIDRLVVRHQELKRTSALISQKLVSVTSERDSLRSRLAAARARIDALLARLPVEAAESGKTAGAANDGARPR